MATDWVPGRPDRIPVTDAVPGAVPPARRSRSKPIKLTIVGAVGVLALVGGVTYGCITVLKHDAATIQRYFRTIGSGDSAGACAMLTDAGQAKLMAQERSDTCPAAAAHWVASLTPSQRDWLVHGQIWVNQSVSADDRKEITLIGDPLGYKYWAIHKHAGQEWIMDWGPGAKQIPDSD